MTFGIKDFISLSFSKYEFRASESSGSHNPLPALNANSDLFYTFLHPVWIKFGAEDFAMRYYPK
jgi:hypothetical protein